MNPVSREEFNGLGERVTKNMLMIAEVTPMVKRNAEDIQKTFNLMEKASKSMNAMIWKIFIMVSVPSGLILYQIISKAG